MLRKNCLHYLIGAFSFFLRNLMIIGATTWASRSYGIGRELGHMRGRIKNHVNEFIKAYSAANSKLNSSPQSR